MARILRAGLLLSVLSAALVACAESEPTGDAGDAGDASDAASETVSGPTIQPFSPPRVTLTVNQALELWVVLSSPVSSTTFVQVRNLYPQNVSVVPASLLYSPGEQQTSATLTALQQTEGLFVPITFQILPAGPTRTLEVMVKLW